MPLYSFACPHCEKNFDKIVPVDTEIHFCPECMTESPRVLETGKTGISFRFNYYAPDVD